MSNILTEIIGYLVGGIKSLGTGIAEGVGEFAKALFLDVTPATSGQAEVINGLSTFGVLICIFGGLALATALTTKIFMWIKSLGAK